MGRGETARLSGHKNKSNNYVTINFIVHSTEARDVTTISDHT